MNGGIKNQDQAFANGTKPSNSLEELQNTGEALNRSRDLLTSKKQEDFLSRWFPDKLDRKVLEYELSLMEKESNFRLGQIDSYHEFQKQGLYTALSDILLVGKMKSISNQNALFKETNQKLLEEFQLGALNLLKFIAKLQKEAEGLSKDDMEYLKEMSEDAKENYRRMTKKLLIRFEKILTDVKKLN